ncbi:hypothetical protein [Rhodococcus globerulus]|uniref:Uncharacterized protein n=1 Tax=Rhodococcus globerulus TaxID=33008 RepID=A0ABU4C5D0_RHOGO|nr:hypothetical protein [Rhodococcus globerulus]MDV6271624.1 hypothetical protein [Rhodococcus globerulus]
MATAPSRPSTESLYSADDLKALGYAGDRLTELFGFPEADRENWRAETIFAVERDVLASAARIVLDAFAPEWNLRLGMIGSNLPLGWPQMEQMLARVILRENRR